MHLDNQYKAIVKATTPTTTRCPECGGLNLVQAPPDDVAPAQQCAACPQCSRVYRVYEAAQLADEAELAARGWAPMAGGSGDAPCHAHAIEPRLIRGRICIMCQHGHCLEAMTPAEWAGSRLEAQIGQHTRDGCSD